MKRAHTYTNTVLHMNAAKQRWDVLADVLAFSQTQLRINDELMSQLAAAQTQLADHGDALLALSNRIESIHKAISGGLPVVRVKR